MASTSGSKSGSIPPAEDRMDVDTETLDTGRASNKNAAAVPAPRVRASSMPLTLRESAYQVGYVYSSKMMAHSCVHGHCEQPERISRIFDILNQSGCLEKMKRLPIRRVLREEALLVHSQALWDKVLALHCRQRHLLHFTTLSN